MTASCNESKGDSNRAPPSLAPDLAVEFFQGQKGHTSSLTGSDQENVPPCKAPSHKVMDHYHHVLAFPLAHGGGCGWIQIPAPEREGHCIHVG
jgi:hypothetical protein